MRDSLDLCKRPFSFEERDEFCSARFACGTSKSGLTYAANAQHNPDKRIIYERIKKTYSNFLTVDFAEDFEPIFEAEEYFNNFLSNVSKNLCLKKKKIDERSATAKYDEKFQIRNARGKRKRLKKKGKKSKGTNRVRRDFHGEMRLSS